MALEVVNISLAYGRITALRNVSVQAQRGEVIAVIGPNAAGKSTLLRCIAGALTPSSGRILLDAMDVHRLTPRALASRMAYVSQRSVVSAAFTVRQVVELGRYALPASASTIQQMLDRFDLLDLEHRPYRTLSVGQQQRVALARAMAQMSRDGVLVLDEPTAAMDLRHAADTYAQIRYAANQGALVVIALHDIATAAMVADEVWLLDRGMLVAAGPTCDVMTADRLTMIFGVGFRWLVDPSGYPRLLPDAVVLDRDAEMASRSRLQE